MLQYNRMVAQFYRHGQSFLSLLARRQNVATKAKAPSPEKPLYTAVVRYDNNCATVPFVGSHEKAEELKERMTRNTHKHHIYLMETKTHVPLGPYSSLSEVKAALHDDATTTPEGKVLPD